MKRYAKRLKEYEVMEFDAEKILKAMKRLKGARRKPTSIALEDDVLADLKEIADRRGVPYQVLMRMLVVEGVRRLKKVA